MNCKQFEQYVSEEPSPKEPYKQNEIAKVTEEAVYDLTLAQFVKDQRQLLGKTVTVLGTIVDPIFILEENAQALEIQCRERMRDSFRVVVEFKEPLPKQNNISGSAPYFGFGKQIRVFGKFVGNKEYVSLDGLTWRVPTIQTILIYDAEDMGFARPMWATDTLRIENSREGEVTIDTMKVFWQNEPDSAAIRKKQ